MILNNNGKVELRYDTTENWNKFNPVLQKGEMVVEVGGGKCYLKVGNGSNKYSELGYITSKNSDSAEWANNCEHANNADRATNASDSRRLKSDDIKGAYVQYIYVLPYIHYSQIDPTHTDSVYFKELLKWICRNYPNLDECRIFIGHACPNSQGVCMIHIYSTVTDSLVDGLPYHCSGVYFGYNNVFSTFGTIKGVYHYKDR